MNIFTRGLTFFFILDDIDLPNGLDVFVKDVDCGDLIENLYYACQYQPICIYCGEYLENADKGGLTYPQCVDCDGPEVAKRI